MLATSNPFYLTVNIQQHKQQKIMNDGLYQILLKTEEIDSENLKVWRKQWSLCRIQCQRLKNIVLKGISIQGNLSSEINTEIVEKYALSCKHKRDWKSGSFVTGGGIFEGSCQTMLNENLEVWRVEKKLLNGFWCQCKRNFKWLYFL